jgi:restriction system protein
MEMETRFADVTVAYSARGVPMYSVEAFHDGLHKYALLRSPEKGVLLNKAQATALQWNAAWHKQTAAENRIKRTFEAKEARRLHIENQKEVALERTTEAQQQLDLLRTTLARGIESDPTLDWEELKIKDPFRQQAPIKPDYPVSPSMPDLPYQPQRSDYKYQPQLSILDRLVSSRKAAKLAELSHQYESDVRDWEYACSALTAQRQRALEQYRAFCAGLDEQYAQEMSRWKLEQDRYYDEIAQQGREVDQVRDRYMTRAPDAVIDYCERVLSRSDHPSCIPRKFDFEWNAETGMLILNNQLPAPEDLPTLAEVKYVQATDTLKEVFLSESQGTKLYDDVVYQIALRTLHELFQSDSAMALSAVVFNGIVTSTDKSTGNQVTSCILSLQAVRAPFLAINLDKVDPKACFRQLRGVGSSKLHSVTPVAMTDALYRHMPLLNI